MVLLLYNVPYCSGLAFYVHNSFRFLSSDKFDAFVTGYLVIANISIIIDLLIIKLQKQSKHLCGPSLIGK